MKLGPDKIIVEPLDDERLVNLERRIVANAGDRLARPLRARRPWLAYGAATAMVAAAFVVGWKLKASPATSPDVVAAAVDPIHVHTDAQRSVLDIGDATIESAPNTVFAVTRPAGGVLVDMAKGRVELAVGKRGDRPPLVVRAGDTDVIVVGTKFSVDYHDGTGEPDVRVTEGIVRVVHRVQHVEVKVAAGHEWHATTGVTEIIAMAPTSPTGDTIGNDVEVGGAGATTSGSNGAPNLRDHVAAVPDAHLSTTATPIPTRGSGGAALGGGPEVSHRPPGIDPPKDPHGELKREIRGVALPAPLAVDAPDAASAIGKYYAMLAASNGDARNPEAESRAMYGLAYTYLMKLGRTDKAHEMIDRYVERFRAKHFAEYDAILWLEVRAECLNVASTDARCHAALDMYLRDASGDAPGRAVARLGTE